MSTPMHLDPIPFITLPSWIKAAAKCGFVLEPLLAEAGIETDLVHLERATVEPGRLLKVMQACIRHSKPGRHFPFVLGETFAFDYMPELETFVTTSPRLRDALPVFDWVRALINPMIDVRLAEQGDETGLILSLGVDGVFDPLRPYFTETTIASIVKFGRLLVEGPLPGLRLDFRHPAPDYAQAYRDYFGCAIAFGQPYTRVVMATAAFDMPLQGGSPMLHRQAQARVEQRLATLPRRAGLVAEIERVLAEQPALLGQGIDGIATVVGLHPRALQRRLQRDGQQYAELQDRARFRLAVRWLDEDAASLDEISERLGYSDRRSFTRAFTRWSGLSPSAYREHRDA